MFYLLQKLPYKKCDYSVISKLSSHETSEFLNTTDIQYMYNYVCHI